MISSLLIIHGLTGGMVAYRDFVPEASKKVQGIFTNHILINLDAEHSPLFSVEDLNICYIKHTDCYLVAASSTNADINSATAFSILHSLVTILDTFLDGFTSARKLELNIVVVLRVLAECSSNGQIFNFDLSFLQNLARPTQVYDTSRSTGSVVVRKTTFHPSPVWSHERPAPLTSYDENEIEFTISERADVVVDLTGNKVESCVVLGAVNATVHLVNSPEITATLSDNVNISQVPSSKQAKGVAAQSQASIELCDVQLHRSVDIAKFHIAKKLVFVPVEEEFRLFSYRLNKVDSAPILCIVTNRSNPQKPLEREYHLKLETLYPSRIISKQIVISVPVMMNIDSPKLQTRRGIMKYCPHEQVVKWILESLPGKQIFKALLNFGVPSRHKDQLGCDATSLRPIVIEYTIPYHHISGLNIDKCVVDADYSPEVTVTKSLTGMVVIKHTIV
ncbi:Adaptor protein complex, medium subunit family protein [Giardia duodenalis]|uniref:Adaptor protein complex, medium subunit family protein n=1 Tax=Giardia intestinalis TaxID=5741 RepID=V6TCX5_GIAIN|nr:Adaptor protein complex, medium subunit family protein [Giardia intestinalis]